MSVNSAPNSDQKLTAAICKSCGHLSANLNHCLACNKKFFDRNNVIVSNLDKEAIKEDEWKSLVFRKTCRNKIEDSIRNSELVTVENSTKIEACIFEKAKTRKEYLDLIARAVIRIREKGDEEKQIRMQESYVTVKVAVCKFCGFLSVDFNRCTRCKKFLPKDIKSVVVNKKLEDEEKQKLMEEPSLLAGNKSQCGFCKEVFSSIEDCLTHCQEKHTNTNTINENANYQENDNLIKLTNECESFKKQVNLLTEENSTLVNKLTASSASQLRTRDELINYRKENKHLKFDLKKLSENNERLNDRISILTMEKFETNNRLIDTKNDLTLLQKQLEQTKTDLNTSNNEIKMCKEENEALKLELENIKIEMKAKEDISSLEENKIINSENQELSSEMNQMNLVEEKENKSENDEAN